MSNVELVRAIYDAFNRRDWDAAFRDQSPDGELILPSGPNSNRYQGRDAIQGYWEEMLSAFDALLAEPEQLLEAGDQVVAIVRTRAQPKGTSAEIETRNGHLWTVRDGKGVCMQLFPAPEDALEAAGVLG